MNLNPGKRKRMVSQEFFSRFGREPAFWVRAPGRVDLMGSHTDYNEGLVLTLAIDVDTWIAAMPRSDGKVRVQSLNRPGLCAFDTDRIMASKPEDWSLYIQAVAQVLSREGYPIGGCDALVQGIVPLDSGLSSSASLEAATAVMFRELGAFEIDGVLLAKLCQEAENEIVGMNCGILDQYSSIMSEQGAAVVLDCRSLTHENVPFPSDLTVVICDTCVPRKLTDSEYGDRRESCETGAEILGGVYRGIRALRDVSTEEFEVCAPELDPKVEKRCRFVIQENSRVIEMANALRDNDREAVAALTRASFEGARDLFEIFIPEMEAMMASMLSGPGIVGARQAGAGMGGCMVSFVDCLAVEEFEEHVARDYQESTGIEPETYAVRAAAGAGRLEV